MGLQNGVGQARSPRKACVGRMRRSNEWGGSVGNRGGRVGGERRWLEERGRVRMVSVVHYVERWTSRRTIFGRGLSLVVVVDEHRPGGS